MKRLYVAYGSNLNLRQMKWRCPTAKICGTGIIENYELQFKGSPSSAFATIGKKEGASVPVAVWEIWPVDEKSLDSYEGFPSHYYKEDITALIKCDNKNEPVSKEITAMVYIMNQKMQFGIPSQNYYNTIFEGYRNCGLDTDILNQAVEKSIKAYQALPKKSKQFSLFDDYDFKPDEDEYYSEEEELEADQDEDEEFEMFNQMGL